jgi:hypothetical protein
MYGGSEHWGASLKSIADRGLLFAVADEAAQLVEPATGIGWDCRRSLGYSSCFIRW